MGFKAAVKRFFGYVGGLAKRAFEAAQANGLTDRIVADAVTFARQAAKDFSDNAEKRAWVVEQLQKTGVSASIAGFAVEAAVQLLKRELAGR